MEGELRPAEAGPGLRAPGSGLRAPEALGNAVGLFVVLLGIQLHGRQAYKRLALACLACNAFVKINGKWIPVLHPLFTSSVTRLKSLKSSDPQLPLL